MLFVWCHTSPNFTIWPQLEPMSLAAFSEPTNRSPSSKASKPTTDKLQLHHTHEIRRRIGLPIEPNHHIGIYTKNCIV